MYDGDAIAATLEEEVGGLDFGGEGSWSQGIGIAQATGLCLLSSRLASVEGGRCRFEESHGGPLHCGAFHKWHR